MVTSHPLMPCIDALKRSIGSFGEHFRGLDWVHHTCAAHLMTPVIWAPSYLTALTSNQGLYLAAWRSETAERLAAAQMEWWGWIRYRSCCSSMTKTTLLPWVLQIKGMQNGDWRTNSLRSGHTLNYKHIAHKSHKCAAMQGIHTHTWMKACRVL